MRCDTHKPKLLVVIDHEELSRRLYSTLLTREGFGVDFAFDGASAVAAAMSTDYGAILLDIEMPTMDGLEAARRIRQVAKRAAPIIAVTADVSPSRVVEFKRAGIDFHLGKPIRRNLLLARINEAVGQQAAVQTSAATYAAAFDELRELIGRDAAAAGLVRLQTLIQQLLAASPENEPELASQAHRLVGHAALLGFAELSSFCKKLEEACKTAGAVSDAFEAAKLEAKAALTAVAQLGTRES